MKTYKNYYEMEPGDTVILIQGDGQELHVMAAETGIVVKAPSVGTKLEAEETATFTHFLKVVEV